MIIRHVSYNTPLKDIYSIMRAIAIISSILSSVIASVAVNELALRSFILQISKYPIDSIPTKLPAGVRGTRRDLLAWANLSQSDFINTATEEIRMSHSLMMDLGALGVLFRYTLGEMTTKYPNDDERIAEFAKIYRDALRRMEDFEGRIV